MLLFRSNRPERITRYVKNNEPSSVIGSAGDNWKKYLSNNGGTGQTFHDLEKGYLRAQSMSTWDRYLESLGIIYRNIRDGFRDFLSRAFGASSSYLLQEDGVSKFTLEDGSGFIILE